ncbi:hypothetical protein RHMOL_Rhmol06G0161100 [Rhododendron molle]|uniref:Uncharacterized protein n=1 Tax=Rhododendron molle TaxID=49168 RepID=A0ACC0ND01_RHOML|nr:hypothetical protein RHMOL_Rhmol06G0161100 [Rhododendron molle]
MHHRFHQTKNSTENLPCRCPSELALPVSVDARLAISLSSHQPICPIPRFVGQTLTLTHNIGLLRQSSSKSVVPFNEGLSRCVSTNFAHVSTHMAIEGGNALGDDESFDHDECKKVKGSPTPKPKKDYIQARISLRSIVKIISKLSLEQSEAIREIGLGGLMGLRCMKQDHILTRWLIKNFDPESSSMDMFMDNNFYLRRLGFIMYWGLKDYLKETKSVGDDFKIKFVLYVLGAFLCPTTKPALKKSYLHAVKNVEAMKECNWAKLTLEFLIGSIRKCKQKGHLRANGCLLLLVVYMKFTHIEKQNQASPENTNFEEQNQESSNDEGLEEHKQPSPKTICICNDSRIAKVESELVEFKKSFDQYRCDDNWMTKVEKELTKMKMIFIENHCYGDRMAKVETKLVGMKSLLTQTVTKVSRIETVSLQPVEVNCAQKNS